jgi:LytS/YehU family sensor histidine kinase
MLVSFIDAVKTDVLHSCMKSLQGILRKLFESRMNIHFAFIILFLATFCLPSSISGLVGAKLFRVFLYGVFLLLCIYTGRWCCRKWLLSNEYQKFIIFSCTAVFVLIITGIMGSMFLTNNSIIAISFTVLFAVILFFSLGCFFSITRTTILRQLKEARIAREQKESELRLLKSQLSPHFLFNVLNNLYGLSLKRDEKVSPMILKLSGLLRYSLYDTSNNFVPLQNELDCIENYIELEKMRIGARLSLEVNLAREKINNILIAPMLFMVFVENAFKHSTDTRQRNVLIKIDFRLIDDWMELVVKNNMPGNVKPTAYINNSSGIGLSVTKKRLELLYPNRYSLEICSEAGFYEINLKIKPK